MVEEALLKSKDTDLPNGLCSTSALPLYRYEKSKMGQWENPRKVKVNISQTFEI